MNITHEELVGKIVETLQADDGAGSDLVVGDRYREWLEVRGNLDVYHLASDVLRWLGPRQATSAEELDALPVGQKIVSGGYVWTKEYQSSYTPGYESEREVWFNVYEDIYESIELELPATLLWEPQP